MISAFLQGYIGLCATGTITNDVPEISCVNGVCAPTPAPTPAPPTPPACIESGQPCWTAGSPAGAQGTAVDGSCCDPSGCPIQFPFTEAANCP